MNVEKNVRSGVDSRAPEVCQQLERILSDPAFSGSNRRSRLLRYLVEQTLENSSEALKESVIGMEVFGRAADYDPQIDSIVRVEVGRLRARLAEYYANAGPAEPVRIEIPKGSYRPIFVFREDTGTAMEAVIQKPPARTEWNWKLVAVGAAALAVMGAAVAFWRVVPSTQTAPASIAVLPFLNLSGDPGDAYLGDGMTDELTETLAEFNDLRVVARTSAFAFKGKSGDIRKIGQSLRAAALIEGSVSRHGGQLHVTAQLIRTGDGYHLWSHGYDATLEELPTVEAGIAEAAREKLSHSPPISRTRAGTAPSAEGHDLYLRAAYELNLNNPTSARQAIELAGKALEKDPSFAQPYVLMAAAESQLNTMLAQPPHLGAQRAMADIAKALDLDPGNSGARAQEALLAYTDQWDWPRAEREFKMTLATASHAVAENLYGWCLMTRGRFPEARMHLQSAAELDPLSLGPQLNQVQELVHERAYPEAKSKVGEILRAAPANPVALYLASAVAFWQRDCTLAAAVASKITLLRPDTAVAVTARAAAEAVCGQPIQAEGNLVEYLRKHPQAYVSPYTIAASYALASDAEHAIPYLEKSAQLREPALLSLKVDRIFDSIRRDPRFIALERRLGFSE